MAGIVKTIFGSFAAIPVPAPQAEPESRRTGSPSTRALAGGRVSFDTPDDASAALRVMAPPPTAEQTWHWEDLDSETLKRTSPQKLMELLADLSPEVSRALDDYLRMCNPGWDVWAYRPGTEEVDEGAQAAIDAFFAKLSGYYGSVDVVLNRLLMGPPVRGGILAELVLDKRGKLPIDFVTPDPASVRFRKVKDEQRGSIWQMYQWQNGAIVPLDRETLRYIPIDPFPGQAYGRPMFSAALFSCLFLISMLHDIKRVVQQQGYPRLDIILELEKLLTLLDDQDREDAEKVQAFLQDMIGQVATMYASLQPDDAYVHMDFAKVNRPVGAVDAFSIAGISQLIRVLEGMATRALKSTGLMMILDGTTNEAQANREWEIYAARIKAIQHHTEQLLEYLLGIALRVQGIQATVKFRFAELRAAELLRDAQVERLTIDNARLLYDNGIISQNEQAQRAARKEQADAPEPRSSAKAGGALVGGQPDPGSTRALLAMVDEIRQARGAFGRALMERERRNGHHKEV